MTHNSFFVIIKIMNDKFLQKIKAARPYFIPALIALEAVFLLIVIAFTLHVVSLRNIRPPLSLSQSESASISLIRQKAQKDALGAFLRTIPYESAESRLSLTAGSAILIDAETGAILYKKNADEKIPPASMTKLVVMYIVFKEIASARISYDDIVPLPKECWAKNMPPDSSLMFLASGQTVTVKELLTGLAVASGNDAAVALAYYISGSVPSFVERMNAEIKALGLTETHFVEPSGYDERNITTAAEFAAFSRRYVTDFPDSINLFHSCREIYYPLSKNLSAQNAAKYGDSLAVHQKNTNPLLGLLDGVDGLKTGFIYESGYNLALTAKRDGRRYISVTMKGAGKGSRQGQANRVKDGTALMEMAFASYDIFRDKTPPECTIRVLASKTKSAKLVCAPSSVSLTIPIEYRGRVSKRVSIPPYIFGEQKAGSVFGRVEYYCGDDVIASFPLILDRNTKSCGALTRAIDRFAARFIK